MAIVQVRGVSFSYGGQNLLENITFQIEPGERIGLMGRNGAGKSTLMKILAGDLAPDEGEVYLTPGLKIARLAQEVPQEGDITTVFAEVAGGFGEAGRSIARIHTLTEELKRATSVAATSSQGNDRAALQQELDALQSTLDAETSWRMQHQVDSILSRMNLDPEARFNSLSSGMKRRVLLARALVEQPDLLLLDEPTNHLDIDAIRWLEDFLLREGIALLFVTHDRAFLQRLATRIIEIERGRIFDWTCSYSLFLQRKEAALEAEAKQEALFDKKLAQEEVWIRTGIKARRTRNEGRVRALEKLREERSKRRSQAGNVRLQTQEIERSGNLVASMDKVSVSFGDKQVLRDVSTAIYRGDKVGILGPNGAGKTTLLRTLLGDLKPDSGTVRQGLNLQIAYFDQLRGQLDEDRSAAENVADGNDTVLVNGASRHIISYLNDFLFSGERARTLVRYLSGGERNRVLLAKLFTKPANVLVLDEPTNDLDAETLELLEDLLVQYQGTLLLVSHDRTFVNNVVTSTLAFEGNGTVAEHAGGYDDWRRLRAEAAAAATASAAANKEAGLKGAGTSAGKVGPGRDANREAEAKGTPARPRKLSFKEQRELEQLPGKIETLEAEQADLQKQLSDPGLYQRGGNDATRISTRLAALDEELSAAYARWEELEAI